VGRKVFHLRWGDREGNGRDHFFSKHLIPGMSLKCASCPEGGNPGCGQSRGCCQPLPVSIYFERDLCGRNSDFPILVDLPRSAMKPMACNASSSPRFWELGLNTSKVQIVGTSRFSNSKMDSLKEPGVHTVIQIFHPTGRVQDIPQRCSSTSSRSFPRSSPLNIPRAGSLGGRITIRSVFL
jgi:hypothetical protein